MVTNVSSKNHEESMLRLASLLIQSQRQIMFPTAVVKKRMKMTVCKICSAKWIDLTENSGIWVHCDICDDYICPNCYTDDDLKDDEDFYCYICSN